MPSRSGCWRRTETEGASVEKAGRVNEARHKEVQVGRPGPQRREDTRALLESTVDKMLGWCSGREHGTHGRKARTALLSTDGC